MYRTSGLMRRQTITTEASRPSELANGPLSSEESKHLTDSLATDHPASYQHFPFIFPIQNHPLLPKSCTSYSKPSQRGGNNTISNGKHIQLSIISSTKINCTNTMEVPHFSERHGNDVYGPFSFLNPTARHYRLPSHKLSHQASQEDLRNKESGNGAVDEAREHAKKQSHEVPAGDVERLFRTRDNRKGTTDSSVFHFRSI